VSLELSAITWREKFHHLGVSGHGAHPKMTILKGKIMIHNQFLGHAVFRQAHLVNSMVELKGKLDD
jgi:hypothetical protein